MKTRTNLFFVAVVAFWVLGGSALAQWTEAVPVTEINTEYAEWDPFLSDDGLSLYISKGKTDTFYYHRLYEAMREAPYGPFTSLREITELNYSSGHIQDPWVSPDNLRLYYMRTEPPGRWRLKFSERASVYDPWPVGVNISELNALSDCMRGPTLTADELTIFFSSHPTCPIPGGEGGDDIWMATRPDMDSPFGDITNLTEINTTANEGGPSVSPVGLTLVFHSDRNGQTQIFKATRESAYEPFGNVEHLSACDTPAGSATPCLSSDGTAIYFKHGANKGDIWVSYLVRREVAVDIKPGSCPNPLNLASRGVLPVAILGSDDLDVNTIDVASIRLAGVAPVRSSYEDVAAPVSDGNECDCTVAGPDGHTDLTLKFKTQQIVEQIVNLLGELVDGELLVLNLAGALSDGTPIEGTDCIVLVGKVPRLLAARSSDINTDGIVDILDFSKMAKYWLEPTAADY